MANAPTQAPSAAVTAGQARAALSAGLEDQLALLRCFDVRKRNVELASFLLLWVCGAGLTLFGYYDLAPGVLHYALWGIGTFLSAVALNAFVLLLHEGMHHVLFAHRLWNRWVSVALGSTVLMSYSAYRVMHLRHHTFLGDPRDPDDYHNYSGSRVRVWVMHFMRLLGGAFLYLLLIPLLALRHGSGSERRQIAVEYCVLALLYGGIVLTVPGPLLLLGWFIPVVLVAYMTNLRGFTQHGLTDATDAYLASRSVQAHPVVAHCLLNENFHLEHHLFPEVPSYNLARLHELIWGRLPRAVTARSYSGFLLRFLRQTWTMDETPIGLTTPASPDKGPPGRKEGA
ncbi:MAG TPA: fatty acid desaturase [Gemmataceae bacterium]|jgi:fatty acid desaturase|nr:fatty acid desaturase [Gemmataceae bacterium]